MICYRDRTFCSRGEGCTCPPECRLTDKVWEDARRWWGRDGAPVAYAVLCPEPERPASPPPMLEVLP